MAEERLTEERVRSLVQETVQEYLTARVDDVDEIRKSPAGRILILETEIKNLNKKVDRLDEKIESFRAELKQEIADSRLHLQKGIESSKNLSLVLFIAILGLIGSIFVKIFFFM